MQGCQIDLKTRYRPAWGPLLLPLALPLVLLLRAAGTRCTLVYDDLGFWFFPWKALQHQMAQNGHLWLWDPWEFCGTPHFADIQRQLLYPPNVMFYVLPTAAAMVLFLTFHLALAGCSTWHLLRTWGVESLAAGVGAMVYASSGVVVLHAAQLPVLATCAWLPLMLWMADRLRARPDRTSAIAAGLLLATVFLAGSPQIFAMQGLLVTIYLLWSGRLSRPLVAACLGAIGLAALLCLPQILATAELAQWSLRAADTTAEFNDRLSLPWSRLLSALVPFGFARDDSVYDFHEVTCFVGSLALFAMLLAGRSERRRMLRYWLCTLAGALGLALGGHFFLHGLLTTVLPVYRLFRVPARWLLIVAFAAAVLSALGVEALLAQPRPRVPLTLLWLAGVAVSAVLPDTAPFLLFWTAGWLALVALPPRPAALALGLLLMGELLTFSLRYITFTPVAEVGAEVRALAQADVHAEQGRILTNTEGDLPGTMGMWSPLFDLSNLQGSNPLTLASYQDYLLCACTGQLPTAQQKLGLLDHNGFVVMGPVGNPMMRMLNLQESFRWEHGAVRVQRERGALGTAWAVAGCMVQAREDALRDFAAGRIDPRQVVTLEAIWPGRAGSGPVQAHIERIGFSPDHLRYDVDLSRDAFVVQSEVYYPGWKARVDGKAVPLWRADGLLRVCPVPAGHHVLEVDYEPWWTITFLPSGLALAVALLLLKQDLSVR
ncbi:MAG: hypothetical protein ACYCW6_27955 [Candidatus Xenobia bacterium]